jgi:hypothetical protein
MKIGDSVMYRRRAYTVVALSHSRPVVVELEAEEGGRFWIYRADLSDERFSWPRGSLVDRRRQAPA